MEHEENTPIDWIGWACVMIIMTLLMGLWAIMAYAATATVTWNANTEPDLKGYYLYRSSLPCAQVGPLGPLLDPTGVQVFSPKGMAKYLDTVPDGTYCYEVTAVDLKGNISSRSNRAEAVVDTNPPSPPQNLAVTVSL
jgi:endoglucanase